MEDVYWIQFLEDDESSDLQDWSSTVSNGRNQEILL